MRRFILLSASTGAVFLVVLVYWLVSDEPLSAGARAWMEPPVRAVSPERNLFYVVVGLTAPPGEEPVAAGKALVERTNEALDEFLAQADADEPRLPDEWKVTPDLAALEEICSPSSRRCLSIYRDRAAELTRLAGDHGYVLSRLERIAPDSIYRNTITPSAYSPFPAFTPLINTHRLRNAVASLELLHGDAHGAIRQLLEEMDLLRKAIASANTFLAKMVFASMLAEDLFLYAEWMELAGAPSGRFPQLPPLAPEAFDFEEAVRYEFLLNVGTIKLLEREPRKLGLADGEILLSILGVKQNASVNMLHEGLRTELQALGSAPRDLASRASNAAEDHVTWIDYVYNPVGTILYAVSRPSLANYGLRMHELDGLVTLVNAKQGILSSGIAPSEVGRFLHDNAALYSDPFSGGPLRWDAVDGVLHFESPLQESRYARLTMPAERFAN